MNRNADLVRVSIETESPLVRVFSVKATISPVPVFSAKVTNNVRVFIKTASAVRVVRLANAALLSAANRNVTTDFIPNVNNRTIVNSTKTRRSLFV